jgi:sugar (pentulose or hexulose) kinase
MIECVLGIDVGTSGVRVAARSKTGTVAAVTSHAMDLPIVAQGRVTQDPALWWDAVVAAVRKLDLSNLHVRAIAIDGTSGTVLPIDGKGQPTAWASLYNDRGDDTFCKRIAEVAPPETAAHGSTSALARVLALQDKAARILHQADWLLGKFCGCFDVTDENNALKTGYDPVARQWPSWLAEVGADAAKLPAVFPVGTRVGQILPDVARTLGLPHDVALVTGTTDGCAGFLASGATKVGDGVTSLGTTLTLKLLSATPVFAPAYGIYSHRMRDRWLAGGASNSGGAVLRQFFNNDDIERLSTLMTPQEATGLNYYPLPGVGERFPTTDPDMAPQLSPRPVLDHVFLQGLFEGIAGIEALGYRRLAELGATPLQSIRSAGGGAANDAWTTIRLRHLNVVMADTDSTIAAMGTARLAWWGLGHDA